jgi:2'-5' RNA ligase
MGTSNSKEALITSFRQRLQDRYEGLWSAAIPKIRAGNIEIDPVLAAGLPDRRRGLTLIGRPSPQVRRQVAAFVRRLRSLEPDQLYYTPSQLHLTVLSLFTAMVAPETLLARTKDYVAGVDAVLSKAASFQVELSGITASSGAVMIQGFLENESLNEIRDALRAQLRAGGLGVHLDGRYRLVTAHMTVARFRAPLRDSGKFAAALEEARDLPFGVTKVTNIRLVKNDWYMTTATLEIIKRYRLAGRVVG